MSWLMKNVALPPNAGELIVEISHDAGDLEFLLPIVDLQCDSAPGGKPKTLDRRDINGDGILGRPRAAEQLRSC